jgi:hypothetical protein
MKSKSTFILRLAAQSILLESVLLSVALMLSWKQLSWIAFFSNLFVTSLFALALLLGLLIFSLGTVQPKIPGYNVAPFQLDGVRMGRLAFWLATVVAFLLSLILALMFMN